MTKCWVRYCKKNCNFRFPKNENRRQQWEKAISKSFKSTSATRLCEDHFTKECFIESGVSAWSGCARTRKALKSNAVPTEKLQPTVDPTNKIKKLQRKLFGIDFVSSKIDTSNKFPHESKSRPTNLGCTTINDEIPIDILSTVHDTSVECNTIELANKETQMSHFIEEIPPFLFEVGNDEECINDSHQKIVGNTATECMSVDILKHDVSIQVDGKIEEKVFKSISTQATAPYYTFEMFINDDKGIHFYTGLETFNKFMLVYYTLSPYVDKMKFKWSNINNMKYEDMFLLTLMKLRRSTPDYELHRFFAISESNVSNVFHSWIDFINQLWSLLDTWPSREIVDFYMPKSFKNSYPSTRVIIDATEVPIERPKNPVAQQSSFSTYNHTNTFKILVGATPDGLLSYHSPSYAGSTSDRQIFERSNLIKQFNKGDSIMADRGFNVQDICAPQGVAVNIPHFLKGKSQLPGMTVVCDRKLASKRVHIERIIGSTKTYKILQTPLKSSYRSLSSKIFSVCFMLCNFRECIMRKEA